MIPNIGQFHPQIVHFIVALGIIGVLFRLISLFWPRSWLSPAATTLIVFAAGASVAGVRSGTDAHGVAERIPGARDAVIEHEDWGKRTRNALLVLAGIEILTLALSRKRAGRPLQFLAAVGGLATVFVIYEAAEHGGDLVYEYAGGIGTRSGNPEDITNLLVAGLYHTARTARDSGKSDVAARMVDELARTRPADTTVWLILAESRLRDRKDPLGALAGLDSIRIPENSRFDTRYGMLKAEAYKGLGFADSAKTLLEALQVRHPASQAIKDALAKLTQ
jgi:uncharacterized membrane protein